MSSTNSPSPPIAPSVTEVLNRPAKVRFTPLSARGEPMVWIMGMSLVLCLILIGGLLGRVIFEGFRTFWPREIERVTLADGTTVQGMRTRERDDPALGPPQFLLRVGNREIGNQIGRAHV